MKKPSKLAELMRYNVMVSMALLNTGGHYFNYRSAKLRSKKFIQHYKHINNLLVCFKTCQKLSYN